MNKNLARLIAAAAIAAGTISVVSSPASAEERTCSGRLGAVTVDNLRVPEGATCTLAGTRVEGNIVVESRATLNASNVSVNGSVQAENHRRVVLKSSQVGGSVQLKQGGAAGTISATIAGNRVNGDVQLLENDGTQRVTSNRIGGNLQCKDNAPAPTGGRNQVGGNKEDQCRRL